MKDLTQGSVTRHLLSMWGMFFINMSTSSALSLVNLYWVGDLGPTAQAAASLALIPVMFGLTVMQIVSVGAEVLISQSVGGGNRDRVNRIFNEAFFAMLVFSVIVGAVAWINRSALGVLLTHDAKTVSMIAGYLFWLIPSVVVQALMVVLAGALEATGNVRTGTIAQIGTVTLNAVLAPVLMFGWLGLPRLELAGAGLALLIANGITLAGLMTYLARKDAYLVMRPRDWLISPSELWDVIKIGAPSGVGYGVMASYMLVIALLLRPFGAIEQASFAIGWRVIQTAVLPLMALTSAISVITGQNYGAGHERRVRETLHAGLLFGCISALGLLLLLECSARMLTSIFSEDRMAVDGGVQLIKIVAFSLIPLSIAYVASGVMSARGNTVASLKASVAYAALIVAPAFILAQRPDFNPSQLWYIMLAASCAQALTALRFLHLELAKPKLPADIDPSAEASVLS